MSPADRKRLLFDRPRERFGSYIVESMEERGEVTHVVGKEGLIELCRFLRSDVELRMNFLSDVLGVDHRPRKPRFDVVYHLYSIPRKLRLRLKVRVDEGESVPSVTCLWKGADWAERETYDMFGIRFDGHPDLKRIYLPHDWEGYPLRKDYPLRGYKDRYNPFGVEKG